MKTHSAWVLVFIHPATPNWYLLDASTVRVISVYHGRTFCYKTDQQNGRTPSTGAGTLLGSKFGTVNAAVNEVGRSGRAQAAFPKVGFTMGTKEGIFRGLGTIL